jgi:RNAse (barnase) inhibitor barstar
MYKLFVCAFLFSTFTFLSSTSFAQDGNDFHVVHVQTFKMTGTMGDDADAFNESLTRQAQTINGDSRVLRSYVLRHFWGADSRDLVLITEFENSENLFSFYNELDSIFEKAFSQEQRDKDDALWNKYVGQHSDEIYRVVSDTRK